jgi:ligand-binding sensor domain-containing protein/putative methionine-R-sulfoxide reductase with GAF domain
MKQPDVIFAILLPVLFFVLGSNRLSAQDFDANNFVCYTRVQGLSNNYISGIEQDAAGYIWIATHKGLNLFDGNKFRPLFKNTPHSPIPDNFIVSINHTVDQEIIGATRAGAYAFNPANGAYKKFIIPCDSIIFFWANHALDIVKDKKGNYIISTKTGLYVFNASGNLTRRYDHHTPPDVGKQELIFGGWVNTLTDGCTIQQNGLLGSVYNPYNNNIDTFYVANRPFIKKLITDLQGEMKPAWGGKNGELFILNGNSNSFDVANINTTRNTSSPMPFPIMSDLGWSSRLTYINDSLLTITCKNSGFYVLNYDSHTGILHCDGKKHFDKNVCTTIFKDREGRLWVGTADGLYKQNLRNSLFSVNDLSTQSSFPQNHRIGSIYVEGSSIYTGLLNQGGLVVLDKKTNNIKKQILFIPKTDYNNSIANIFPYDKDTLWIGTNNGIVWLNKNNYHYGHVTMPPGLEWVQKKNTLCFLEDSRKNIWISMGVLNGLIYYNRATRTFSDISPPKNPLLKVTYIFSMAEDASGNIWMAGDGLCRWNIKKQEIDKLIPYPKVGKSLRNYMLILDRDRADNLWLASFDNEIIQYNCKTDRMYLRQEENNFIDGNTITSSPIINNYIWMGTDNGISAFNINNYSVKQFTYADGLPSVAITSLRKKSFYDRESNRFYIGAGHRLISLVPDISRLHKIPPALFIEKINTPDSMIIFEGKDIHLKYRQNSINISFNTINFTDPEENRFAWRLPNQGDTTWNELYDQTSITLTHLSDGWHSVQVKLYSANNHWPQQLRTIRIYIRPPFWETSWFVVLMAVLIAGSIFLIFKKRVNAVRKKEREKALVQLLKAEEYKMRLELEQVSNYFSTSLAGKKNIDDVLWDVTENLIGRMNYEDCIIYLWNEDKSRMVQKAAHGPKGNPKAISMQFFEVMPGQGLVGHVIQTKEPLLVSDTRKDNRYRVDDMQRLSELCVPIIHNNELIGVIDSEHSQASHFKERDIKILSTIATLVGNKMKQLESEQMLEVKQNEIAHINQQLAEAQLLGLQAQMNPHFIFNSLNSIKGMILDNEQEKASRYLSKFANMIRNTLNQSKNTFTTLAENIEHLAGYLEMEKFRFDDSFTFRIIVDDNIEEEETIIPTLMIQPLAENAIWHGLMHQEGEKKLVIRFSQMVATTSCTIVDNGIGIRRSEALKLVNRSPHQSVGLNNLRNRIKIMNEKYDTGCTLEITDLQDAGTGKTGTRAVLCFYTNINKHES